MADVSSFANASGGDILYGITEERDDEGNTTSIPHEAEGLTVANLDELILGLEGSIRSNLDPRIVSQVVAIEGFAKGPVVLIRVQQSWNGPHMVIFKGSSRFFSRTSRGKYQLDVSELRTAFVAAESLLERITEFRHDRLGKIIADETPYPLLNNPRIILHVVPLSSFNRGLQLDVAQRANELSNLVQPIYRSWSNRRFNFDGFVTGSSRDDSFFGGYVQIFRTGVIEAVDSQMIRDQTESRHLPLIDIEMKLITSLEKYFELLSSMNVSPPILLLLSLLGVKGYQVPSRNDFFFDRSATPIERDTLILPDVPVEDLSQDSGRLLRPLFDVLWQSVGYEACPHYDDDGNYDHRIRFQ